MAGRFSISVPGRRGPNDPWFRIGTLDVTTTVFVILMCVVSMLVWALEGPDHDILGKLTLVPELVLDGQVWRVATWPIPNPPDIWLVIMLAVFWYFGTEVERLLGRVRFAVFLGLVTVIPAIVALPLMDREQYGIRPVELCVFLLFVAEFPFVRFFFGIPGWVIGAVILGIEVLQLLGDRNEPGIVFLFVALAVAAITARSMGLLGNYPWVPAVPIGSLSRSRSRRRSPAKQRRRGGGGEVVAGTWSTTSRSGPTGPLPQPPPSAQALSDQAELDAILDKISELGMDGLTGDEKSRLNELSKRMRGR
jgi:hypothetical protein